MAQHRDRFHGRDLALQARDLLLQAELIFDQLQGHIDCLNILRDTLVDQAQILFGLAQLFRQRGHFARVGFLIHVVSYWLLPHPQPLSLFQERGVRSIVKFGFEFSNSITQAALFFDQLQRHIHFQHILGLVLFDHPQIFLRLGQLLLPG